VILKSFRKEIFRPECNPDFTSLHLYAHLDQDIGAVIPYLNTELGGFQCTREPPSVTFKNRGRLITVHARKVAINSLRDEEEADKIMNWLQNQINDVWSRRNEIAPSYETAQRPQIIEILKRLPRTNCRKCGLPTCMVFAARVAEGIKGADDCPELSSSSRETLAAYLGGFQFDV
jgi:ArsR family metal-binding transcriptional regulator